MRSMFAWLRRLHKDERADGGAVGTVLRIALILIPLLIVVLIFKDEVVQAFEDAVNKLRQWL